MNTVVIIFYCVLGAYLLVLAGIAIYKKIKAKKNIKKVESIKIDDYESKIDIKD